MELFKVERDPECSGATHQRPRPAFAAERVRLVSPTGDEKLLRLSPDRRMS